VKIEEKSQILTTAVLNVEVVVKEDLERIAEKEENKRLLISGKTTLPTRYDSIICAV
jgi:hypothetical protein